MKTWNRVTSHQIVVNCIAVKTSVGEGATRPYSHGFYKSNEEPSAKIDA